MAWCLCRWIGNGGNISIHGRLSTFYLQVPWVYLNAICMCMHLFTFVFLHFCFSSEWRGGDFSIHGGRRALKFSCCTCVQFVCVFVFVFRTQLCLLYFCFSSEWSEVKWRGGEVISVFTTGSHLSGSEMGREDFSTDWHLISKSDRKLLEKSFEEYYIFCIGTRSDGPLCLCNALVF